MLAILRVIFNSQVYRQPNNPLAIGQKSLHVNTFINPIEVDMIERDGVDQEAIRSGGKI